VDLKDWVRLLEIFLSEDENSNASKDDGIATGYGLNDRGVRVQVQLGSRIFSTSSITVLRPTQPTMQLVPEVKRPGREADHSPPTSVQIKKTWIHTSTTLLYSRLRADGLDE
jgi:hypothetical protein